MPPIRTKHSQTAESSTSAISNLGTNRRRIRAKPKERATLGVSKLKSAVRQTRRLLAKEGLAADARVEAERKIKALEADLAVAERANKERTLATRYHKVKFFDRQKLLRKIKQTKKRLEDEEVSSKVRKALKAELFELRVDLNYVMNYPKLEKYIALFPPEARHTEGAEVPIHSATPSSSSTDEKREELRERVRGKMRAGEMSGEPETLGHQPSERLIETTGTGHRESSVKKNERNAEGKEKGKVGQHVEALDDFFEEDGLGDEGFQVEAIENVNTRSTKPGAKRRSDKSAAQSDPDPAEKHSKKGKHKKRSEKVVASAIVQDSFFGDESE